MSRQDALVAIQERAVALGKRDTRVNLFLRIPRGLKEQIEKQAAELGVSENHLCQAALEATFG